MGEVQRGHSIQTEWRAPPKGGRSRAAHSIWRSHTIFESLKFQTHSLLMMIFFPSKCINAFNKLFCLPCFCNQFNGGHMHFKTKLHLSYQVSQHGKLLKSWWRGWMRATPDGTHLCFIYDQLYAVRSWLDIRHPKIKLLIFLSPSLLSNISNLEVESYFH